jgi:hypothetical protein
VQAAIYAAMQVHEPQSLKSWLEMRFELLGWSVIFTLPYLPRFQPIELMWADVKGDIGSNYKKGRNFEWIKNRVCDHSAKIDCSTLVRHAIDCMNVWLVEDDVLGGSIDLMNHNAMFLTEEQLEMYNGDANIDVHIVIDDDLEVVE